MPASTHMPSVYDYFTALFLNTKVNAILNLDTQGHIIAINGAFKKYFGYDDKDLLGKHFEVLFTEEDRNQEKPAKELASVLLTGQGTDKNYMVHKDKTITWVSGESILVENERGDKTLLKIIQDIHEQKESEKSLATSNDFNESILRSIEDLVFVLNGSMQLLKYNPAFSQFFSGTVITPGDDFSVLIKPFDPDAELTDKISTVLATGKSFYNQEFEIISDKVNAVYELSCQLFGNPDENGKRVLLTAHDISIQKRSEKEKEDIMGFVAHELRNPLANIILSNELVMDKLKDHITDDIAKVLERSNHNIFRLNKMIAELYDAAKAGSGHFTLELAKFDFDTMIKEAIDTTGATLDNYRIHIKGTTGAVVTGDRYRITQVVTNYLSNAVKYSDKNFPIIIELSSDGKNVTVAVKDKSKGIAPAHLPLVFERFYRAEKPGKTEGIGLGLFLCRRIIELHKGKVWAESKEGEGSTFYFSIPIAISQARV